MKRISTFAAILLFAATSAIAADVNTKLATVSAGA